MNTLDKHNSGLSDEMTSGFGGRYLSGVCLGVICVGILLRFLFLDADPVYYAWAGYITDEGRWVQNARSLALFGELFDQHFNTHFFFAPLFQLTTYVAFKLGGISVLVSRIFTALCGSAILVLFWGFLCHTVTPPALLLGIALLAIQTDLVVLSRVATPEMVLMFFELFVFFLLVSNRGSASRMLLAGALLFLAIGMKITMVLFLGIFSVVIVLIPQENTGVERAIETGRKLLLFLLGFAACLVVAVLMCFSSDLLDKTSTHLLPFLSTYRNLVDFATAYDVLSFPFQHVLAPTFNVWALGLWISALAWMAADRDDIDFKSRRYLVSSAIWFTLYFSIMLVLDYFPTRYKVHIFIPMAVSIAVGLSILQKMTVRKVIDSFEQARGPYGLFRLAVLSFPTAVFLSPLLASVIVWFTANPSRLSMKVACVATLLTATTYAANRLRRNIKAITFLLTFPFIAALAFLTFDALIPGGYQLWPNGKPQLYASVLGWTLFLLLSSVFAIALVQISHRRMFTGCCAGFITSISLAYLAISLIKIIPGYLNPHYTIRDTSRELGQMLSGSNKIVCSRAEVLFNENSLRYKNFKGMKWKADMVEFFVVGFSFRIPEELILKKFQLVRTYNLYISPEFYRLHPYTVSEFPRGKVVRVYRRRES